MSTLESLVHQVLLRGESWLGDQSVVGTLSQAATNIATTMTITGPTYTDGTGVSAGLVEIGEELVYAKSANRTNGTISDLIRGWRGTAAVAHNIGETVRFDPVFPRVDVEQAINDAIVGVFPRLFGVAVAPITAINGTERYKLPTGCDRIVAVYAKRLTATTMATRPLKWWWHDQTMNEIAVPAYLGGYEIRVDYTFSPKRLTDNAQAFSASGLPDWAEEVVVLGALQRLLVGPEMSGLLGRNLEQTMLGQAGLQPPRTGSVTQLVTGLYEQRLAQAEQRLWAQYPPHIVRGMG